MSAAAMNGDGHTDFARMSATTGAGISPQEKAKVIIHDGSGNVVFRVDFPLKEVPRWAEQVVRHLYDLSELPPNWDSYGASRVRHQAIRTTLSTLLSLGVDVQAPDISPVGDGGIQLEWRTPSIDLEIEVTPRGELQVGFDDLRSGDSWEMDIANPRQFAQDILPKISDAIPRG